MKQKNRIPLHESATLHLQTLAADDVSLPKPNGFGKHDVSLAHGEWAKLEETKRFGGLVPIGQDSQYWQCPACGAIHANRKLVARCCLQIPNRVQICTNCLRTHNKALRIGECRCVQNQPPREFALENDGAPERADHVRFGPKLTTEQNANTN